MNDLPNQELHHTTANGLSKWWITLLCIVVIGFAMRWPGVNWGENFPFGWYGHHPDEYTHLVLTEMLLDPSEKPRWPPNPYPKGMAAAVAVPLAGLRFVQHHGNDPLPDVRTIITVGRCISLLYGLATIVVIALLSRKLIADQRVATVTAALLALGGLHVAQSHFFLSDVAALFWLLLGQYFLLHDMDRRGGPGCEFLMLAAICFGAAFGMKLVVGGLPALVIIALWRAPRFMRTLHASMFLVVGVIAINFNSFTAVDLARTIMSGRRAVYEFSHMASALLYGVELPSVIGLPVSLLAVAGAILLTFRWLNPENQHRRAAVGLVVVLPVLVQMYSLFFSLNHFPRHLVPLIPWLCLAAGYAIVRILDQPRMAGIARGLFVVLLFGYQALFVYDNERMYRNDPRNDAARWLQAQVPVGSDIWWVRHNLIKDYKHVVFPDSGRPPVLVIEMLDANHYLSGLGWRNNMPGDYRHVYDGRSREHFDALQSLFRGDSEYREVVRFKEPYFMPEYVMTNRLFGDRSRSYVSEIIIFRKEDRRSSVNGN